MSAILKFDFQKRKQLRFPQVNYLNYTQKKPPILHVTTTFFLKQGETRTSSGPIPHPLIFLWGPNNKMNHIIDSRRASVIWNCRNNAGEPTLRSLKVTL